MARNLMIQGTMSGAGKSILTAGILRVLRQDGFRVAPFKSQNMALNSFVTRDGLEMGRAQAVQAAAAGIEPSSDMNPILLKPMGDAVSEVIVNGRPIGKMRAADYYRVKKSLVPQILEAYHRLEEQAEIIVIEGAGSPVEINLREGDFVNMGLAQMVDAPVLLAGNIDPGGVFAQLLGTVQLMRPEERERVKGLIINKFRGDVRLLEPGLSMFREYCDIPFAGIVPWLKLNLDEEDSLSDKLSGGGSTERFKTAQGGLHPADSTDAARSVTIDIAVIRLPYMSNYTDFAPLEQEDFCLGPVIRSRTCDGSKSRGWQDGSTGLPAITAPGTQAFRVCRKKGSFPMPRCSWASAAVTRCWEKGFWIRFQAKREAQRKGWICCPLKRCSGKRN